MRITHSLAPGTSQGGDGIPSSDVVRERFGDADGLRALAILAVVVYEAIAAAAPQRLLIHPALARIASDASQGLTLFFVLSGFTLAYPALAATRQDGRAFLDIGRYAIKRILRIYPAYLALLALTMILPDLALRYGLPALATQAGHFSAHTFERNAFFAGDGLGNDGFRALAIVARWYLLFPLLLLLWTRSPWIFAGLGVLATLFDFTTPAHGWYLGALIPFMLGIVAAEIRVQHHRFERFSLLFALGAAAFAVLLEPFLKFLPGPAAFPNTLRVDPFWSLALFGLVAGAATFRIVERILSLTVLRILGAASFAISLVVVPVTSFAVRQSSSAFGPLAAAVNAGALALLIGYVWWQVVDRWFAEGPLRRDLAELLGPWVDRVLHLVRGDRVILGPPPPPPEPEKYDDKLMGGFYAPPPRALPADLAVVSKKSGTAEELAAEILETKKRLSERSAQILSEPKSEAAFEKPGFYRKPIREESAPEEPTVDMRRLPRQNVEFQPIDFSRLTARRERPPAPAQPPTPEPEVVAAAPSPAAPPPAAPSPAAPPPAAPAPAAPAPAAPSPATPSPAAPAPAAPPPAAPPPAAPPPVLEPEPMPEPAAAVRPAPVAPPPEPAVPPEPEPETEPEPELAAAPFSSPAAVAPPQAPVPAPAPEPQIAAYPQPETMPRYDPVAPGVSEQAEAAVPDALSGPPEVLDVPPAPETAPVLPRQPIRLRIGPPPGSSKPRNDPR